MRGVRGTTSGRAPPDPHPLPRGGGGSLRRAGIADHPRGQAQSDSKGTGSPASWLRAFIAARCSASFLFRPQAGA